MPAKWWKEETFVSFVNESKSARLSDPTQPKCRKVDRASCFWVYKTIGYLNAALMCGISFNAHLSVSF
jgi:hypothetical protein